MAYVNLYGIYKVQAQSEETSRYYQKAIKLGVKIEELEKVLLEGR
jgi:hypothetical protein